MNKSISSISRSKLSSILNLAIKLEAIAKVLRLQKIFKNCLLLNIRIYQQYISPHKGFACAYRVLHQDKSCSCYFQTCLTEHSFADACISFQERLWACQQANLILQSSRPQRKNARGRKRQNSCLENNNCFNCRDLIEPGWFFSFCNPFDCVDCGDCDL